MSVNRSLNSAGYLIVCVALCGAFALGCDGLFADIGEFEPSTDLEDAGDVGDADDAGDSDVDESRLPQVETVEVAEVSVKDAIVRGELLDLGEPPASDHGVCLGRSASPEDCISQDALPDEGAFEMHFDDLEADTEYFVRAFADNEAGRAYGEVLSFETEGPFLATEVTNGEGYTCAIAQDGTLWCWGSNHRGESGLGDLERSSIPQQVGEEDDWESIAADVWHTCGIRNGGELWCWGANLLGGLGLGDDYEEVHTPHRVGEESDWREISVGVPTCGIRDDGSLWCWGKNANENEPEQVGTAEDWDSISTNYGHACALKDDQSLWCWGSNGSGQLGLGDNTTRDAPQRVDGNSWRSVSAGENYTCAIQEDRSLWCWGNGEHGNLGLTDREDRDSPTRVGDADDWSAISTAVLNFSRATCGIRGSGEEQSLWCWGSLMRGQSGISLGADSRTSPEQRGEVGQWDSISVGNNHGCAITGESELKCWGLQSGGQLGTGVRAGVYIEPVALDTAETFDEIDASISGVGHHGCAISTEGALWCWGSGTSGKLGVGDLDSRKSPVQVGDELNWHHISVSSSHTCGVRDDGTLWCWGSSFSGQLGNGDADDEPFSSPEQVGFDTNWRIVTSQSNSNCALRDNGTLWCWGQNNSGELGPGDENQVLTPQAVGDDESGDWTSLSMGHRYACGISDGELWCWGQNGRGQLGQGDDVSHDELRQVGDHGDWSSVSAGNYHTCAIRNGQLYCWGHNNYGQLGQGAGADEEIWEPTRVGADSNWDAVSAGSGYTCAIRAGGELWCWGQGWHGRLGHGDEDDHHIPRRVGEDQDWSQVSAGSGYTLALRDDGTAWGWGLNGSGQLGVGTAWVIDPTMVVAP